MWAMKRTRLDESKFVREDGQSSQGEDPVNKMRYGDDRRVDKGVPIACDCGAAVSLATRKSVDGRDERYFVCGYDMDKELGAGCGFKRPVEKALLDEIAILKVEKAELQAGVDAANKRVDAATKRIDRDQGTLVWMQVQYEDMMADHKTLEDYSGDLGETQITVAGLEAGHEALERKVWSLEKVVETEKHMLRKYGEVRTKDKGVPRGCDCGKAVIVETEVDSVNIGQKYFSCPTGAVDGCGFKRWWVQAIIEEFELIKEEKESLTKTVDEMKERNGELEERVQAGEDDGSMFRKLGQLTAEVNDLVRKYQWMEEQFLKLDINT